MFETDLYKPVHDYLVMQGYTVHSEVKNCDITAMKGDELVVIELKTAFNLKLLAQGVKRQRIADSVYLAIPSPKGGKRSSGWQDMCLLLRRLELGLILVEPCSVSDNRETGNIEIVFHPHTFDRLKSSNAGKKLRRHIIKEAESRYGDFNKGGSTKRKLMTAYKENSLFIACCMQKYGALSPAKLKKLGTGSKTASILSKNFYGWFDHIAKGTYALNQNADPFLEAYPEIVVHYMEKLEKLEDLEDLEKLELLEKLKDQS